MNAPSTTLSGGIELLSQVGCPNTMWTFLGLLSEACISLSMPSVIALASISLSKLFVSGVDRECQQCVSQYGGNVDAVGSNHLDESGISI